MRQRGGLILGLVLATPLADAGAQDASSAPIWTGFYVGTHAGYGTGGFGGATTPQLDQGLIFPRSITGLNGGYQAGYHVQLPSRIVLGAEADWTLPGPIDSQGAKPAPFVTSTEYFGSARLKLGYAAGTVLPYLTGGLALGRTRTDSFNATGAIEASKPLTHLGWTAGGGIETTLGGRWTGRVEYDYLALGDLHPGVSVVPNAQLFEIGLNYQLGDGFADKPASYPPETDFKNWNIHGQTTVIAQGYPPIRSAYQGPASLPPGGETRDTWTATAFLGARLAPGLEVYFDPELDQGFGIGNTTGIAGFPNGEAQKAGAEFPRFRPQRYFLRETIGLGGETEKLEDGPNQLAETVDVNRLTVTLGRFAIGDYFDNNAYAHDPRQDFLNWSLWEAAAFDFPADLPGFTRGGVAELNTKTWAVRLGYFQVPAARNSDVLTWSTGGGALELETRHKLAGQDGKLRLGAFLNRGYTGNYALALEAAAANPALAIDDAMAATREQRLKVGYYANLEQSLTPDLGLFARLSYNDGRNETLSFTDVDTSVSGGLQLKGTEWGRADDRIGLGVTLDMLSKSHADFLAAGGLGLLIGDGALTYSPEKLLETYYAYNLAKGKTLTADYQFIADPAYNASRGPVSVFSGRLHVEW